jgi:hypothetical protein
MTSVSGIISGNNICISSYTVIQKPKIINVNMFDDLDEDYPNSESYS